MKKATIIKTNWHIGDTFFALDGNVVREHKIRFYKVDVNSTAAEPEVEIIKFEFYPEQRFVEHTFDAHQMFRSKKALLKSL